MAREVKYYVIRAKSAAVLDTLISDVMGMGVEIEHVYRHVFSGFSARLTSLYVKNLKLDQRVQFVEESTEFRTYTKQTDAPWHLDRIDQRVFPLSNSYTYDSDGTGVIAYLLDSGCVFFSDDKTPSDTANFDHVEFGDRVSPINELDTGGVPIPNTPFDPIYKNLQITDPNNSRLSSPKGFDHYGHGTHVAGLIGSATYGVAKNVEIRSAKVLDVFGAGNLTNVVAGIEAILGDFLFNTSGEPAVCNMSLGTNAPTAPAPAGSFELAVQALIDAGITVVAAAGNEGQDANNISPARMPDVITVGAMGRVANSSGQIVGDTIANFSNFGNSENIDADETFGFNDSVATNTGSAIDIFAPGVGITSTYNTSPTALNTFSGTSMAAPLVAGVAVLILQNNTILSPNDVNEVIKINSVEGIIDGVPVGTPNRMLFSTFVDHQIIWATPAGNLGSFPEGFTLNPGVQLVAAGFSGVPLTYSNPSGGLPPGITVNAATGRLDGVAPTQTSDTVYNFDIKASDPSGFEIRSFSMTILDGALPPKWLTDSNLSTIEEGENLSIQLVATSRNFPATPVTYSVVDSDGNPSTLPHGWGLTATGSIFGLVPIVINEDLLNTFIVRADDGSAFTDREFRLTIRQSSFTAPPVWQTASDLGEIIKGEAVSIALLATDADGSPLPIKYKLTVVSGAGSVLGGVTSEFSDLPQGLSLNEDTGEITGPFTGNITDGELVNPLSFDDNTTTFDANTTTLETNEAIFKFQVFATDGAMVVGRLFTLTVFNTTPNVPVEWVTASSTLGTATALSFSSFQVMATDPDGSPQPITYTLDSGELPPGMFLDTNNGIIAGTPANISETSRLYIFGIRASDGASVATRTFSINVQRVNRQPIWITPAGLLIPPVNEGQGFAFQLEAEDPNSEDDLTYTLINNSSSPTLFDNDTTSFDGDTTTLTDQVTTGSSLPFNLVLNSDTGIISGSILDVSNDTTFTFTVRVDDSKTNPANETLFADRQFSIQVVDGALNTNQAPVWITPEGALPDGLEEDFYRYELLAEDSDGPQPLRFIVVAGGLPNGMTLNTTSGVISGVPSDFDLVDTVSTFSVRAFDGVLSTDRVFSINVIDVTVGNLPPVWVTPPGSIGSFNELTPLVFALSAVDPEGENVTFLDSTSSLPFGLSVTIDGIITGVPPQVASDQVFNFSIDAIDESGGVTSQAFQITVLDVANIPPVWVTLPALGSFPEGSFTPLVLSAVDPDAGPLPALIYVDTSGSPTHIPEVPLGATIGLPPGLSLSTGGIITGTSIVTGDTVFSFEITTSDGAANAPEQFVMTITEVVAIPDDRSTLVVRITGNNRQEFKTWNTSDLIFDSELFEPANIEFGRNLEPEIFVFDDIHTITPADITTAFGVHHATFDVLGGIPQSAVVRDTNDDVVYEVVYINIVDPQDGSSFDIPADYATRDPSFIFPPNGAPVSKNFDHLRTELQLLPNSEVLPDWMTSEQIANDSSSILGYTPSIILAYVKPGQSAGILERVNEISVTNETVAATKTTFDINTIFGTEIEPVVSPGDTLTITNGTNTPVEVTFTAFTLLQIVQDINDAAIPGVTATSALIELFVPDVPATTYPGTFQTDHVLSITFDQAEITFSSAVLDVLGLPNVAKETFWNDGSTFDNAVTTELVVEKGPGFQFTGRKLTIDRYLFNDNIETVIGPSSTEFDADDLTLDSDTTTFTDVIVLSTNTSKWIKFKSDTDLPFWITDKGVLDCFDPGESVSIQLEAETQVSGGLEYSLIYGAFPNGVSMNLSGLISGAVLDELTTFDTDTMKLVEDIPFNTIFTTFEKRHFIHNYFVIRATDINGLTTDRGFSISVADATMFDDCLTTFDGDTMTLDVG